MEKKEIIELLEDYLCDIKYLEDIEKECLNDEGVAGYQEQYNRIKETLKKLWETDTKTIE